MTNGSGITWEEETVIRIKDARDKQTYHGKEANRWGEYADTLTKALEMSKEQKSIKSNGRHGLDVEKFRMMSIREALTEIASSNNGLLIVNDAVTSFVEIGLFNNRESARNSIYTNLYHYKKLFRKERPGIYMLVSPNKELSLPLNA